MFIADHENVKESAFYWLAAKLWLKEAIFCGLLHIWMDEFGWVSRIIVCKSSSSFSHNFTANLWKIGFFCFRVTSDYQSLIFENLKVVGLLGEKLDFYILLGIQIEIDFHPTNTRIKLNSFRTLKWYLNRICNQTIVYLEVLPLRIRNDTS